MFRTIFFFLFFFFPLLKCVFFRHGLWTLKNGDSSFAGWGAPCQAPICLFEYYLLWEVYGLCLLATTLPLLRVAAGCSAHACTQITWFSDHRNPCCDTVSQIIYKDILQTINPFQLSAGKIRNGSIYCLVSEQKGFEITVSVLLSNLRECYLGSEFLIQVFTGKSVANCMKFC